MMDEERKLVSELMAAMAPAFRKEGGIDEQIVAQQAGAIMGSMLKLEELGWDDPALGQIAQSIRNIVARQYDKQ